MPKNLSEILDTSAPKWMKALPLGVALVYFGYGYGYRKHSFILTLATSVVFGLAGLAPWLLYKSTNTMPAITSGDSGTVPVATQDASAFTKTERQAAIDYIIAQDQQREQINKVKGPAFEKRVAAMNSLTNDELKVLYVMYKFKENQDKLIAKYGSVAPDDVQARQIAKEDFGMDLTGIDNVQGTGAIAMNKVIKFYES